ncbi:MAG: hypothetical protein WC807_10180 [Hyphomicrobium sp.]
MMRKFITATNQLARAALVAGVALALTLPAQAGEGELSDKSVQVFMDYAWSLTPQQFSKKDGTTIIVDKNKREDAMVPLDVAREVIRVGRISAHAQVCNLAEDQALNHRSLMRRELDKKKWTDQQTLFINQLHLTTVMLLTGKIKLVEKDGDKEVVVDEKSVPTQTCSDEQRTKVKDLIAAYVKAGPALAAADAPAPAAAAAAAPAPKK